MDKQTLEGIIMELDTMLDNAVIVGEDSGWYDKAVPDREVQALRNRLANLLDMTQ